LEHIRFSKSENHENTCLDFDIFMCVFSRLKYSCTENKTKQNKTDIHVVTKTTNLIKVKIAVDACHSLLPPFIEITFAWCQRYFKSRNLRVDQMLFGHFRESLLPLENFKLAKRERFLLEIINIFQNAKVFFHNK